MIASFLASLAAFIAAHPHLAYAGVLLLALSESIPVIGAFVPGTAAILAISALVPGGVVRLWPLLAAASLGAVIGDGVSFWIGHRYQRQFLGRWPLSRRPDLIAHSEAFFARHGDKSVFIARFIPGLRAFIPLIAGMLKMPVRRFYVANILSALVWAPSHILPAVFVGAAFSTLGPAAKPLAALTVLVVLVIWAAVHLTRLALRRAPALATGLTEWVRQRAVARPSRWSRFVLDLLDPARSDMRGLAFFALLLVASAWLFLGVLEDVIMGDPLVRADVAIQQALQELRTPTGDFLMLAVTELGDTVVVIAVALAVFLWLTWRRAWRVAAFWLAAVGGAAAINTAIKIILHRPRPTDLLYGGWSAYSFPSGHSTVNLALYGFLAFLIGRELRPAWRLPVALIALSFALLIAFSRLYLGAHWFSDVVGGLAFATAWLAALGLFFIRRPERPIGAAPLAAIACATLALAGGAHVYRQHSLDVGRYAVSRAVPVMPASDWAASGWQQLPPRRIDITGEVEEPLTVQWAGALSAIQQRLLDKGWRLPTTGMTANLRGRLSGTTTAADLPALPRLSNGRLSDLTLILPDDAAPDSRLVLRLWSADLDLADGHTLPLWTGSVTAERTSHPLSLLSMVWTLPDADAPRDTLAQMLPQARIAYRRNIEAEANWDGAVLLMLTP